jgi:hypothetical protein
VNAFYPDWLEANRRGELSDAQRRNFRAWANSNRRSALGMAGFLLAGAVLVGFFASATAPPVTRAVITAVALLFSVFIGLRAIVGFDALTRDVRTGRVQSVEGAIGKRGSPSSRPDPTRTQLLQVGGQTFQVGPSIYKDAPDAGYVRLYYLPRSRKFVNLERVEREPAPELQGVTGLLNSLGTLKRADGVQEKDEIRAQMADAMDRLSVGFTDSRRLAPEEARDPGPLGELVIGSWSNEMMTVTFRKDGTVAVRMGGMEREGKWSIDAAGRLLSNITGEQEAADARVSGDQLTISQGGTGFRFKRD